jgi:lactoylglutathione lyase
MTRILALLLLCAVSVGATAATAPATPPKTEDDKVVFAIGEILSGSVKPFALTEHEMQLVSAGFAAGMHGAKTSVDADAYRPKIQALLSARAERGLSAAKAAGKAYRDKAATAKDTTTTASGLMMTTLRAGSGASPAAEDEVKVHYVGKLIDGTEFDSSIKRGQPATFKLNGVIPCWTEALPHMKVGGKARLVCPAELAYGQGGSARRARRAGSPIGSGSAGGTRNQRRAGTTRSSGSAGGGRKAAVRIMKYLHTMVRVADLAAARRFYCEALGLKELRHTDYEQGRYTLVFLSAPGDEAAQVELTHNWDPEVYTGGRNFGHLAYEVDDIYATCQRLMDHGVTINRPPRDGRMAFVRSPDQISIELVQRGGARPPQEPWASMPNVGNWS